MNTRLLRLHPLLTDGSYSRGPASGPRNVVYPEWFRIGYVARRPALPVLEGEHQRLEAALGVRGAVHVTDRCW